MYEHGNDLRKHYKAAWHSLQADNPRIGTNLASSFPQKQD